MAFGQFGSSASLSQTIATTPGGIYTISFFLANDNPTDELGNAFAVRWDGSTVFSLVDPQATFGYSKRMILNVTAASSSTVLAFDGQNDSYSWYLDDVTIVDSPEPASLLLTGLGLAAVAAASKRLRRG